MDDGKGENDDKETTDGPEESFFGLVDFFGISHGGDELEAAEENEENGYGSANC